MSRRRVSISSIIGRRKRRRIADHNCQKGTMFPSLINHPFSFLFVLFRCSLSTTTRNPSSPPADAALITNQPKTLPTFRFYGLQDAVTSFNRMIQMRPLLPISHFNKALGPLLKMGHYDIARPLNGKLFSRHSGQYLHLRHCY
ncbi:hypothetical protein CsSME_00038487 [Camellia sinensis var. sinensis]